MNKFIEKSLATFKTGKFYQAEREFKVGLLRSIETKSFDDVEQSLNSVLPILESNMLFHETEIISSYYLVHLKKHKDIPIGLEPILNFLKLNFANNSYPNSTTRFFYGLLNFLENNLDSESEKFIKDTYKDFIYDSKKNPFHSEIVARLFKTLVQLSLFDEVLFISNEIYLKNMNITDELELILYSLLILNIKGNEKKSSEILQFLRKTVPKDIQKRSELFQCCSEFLLASSSKDYGWAMELQQHFATILKEKTLKLLILNLIKTSFPQESKINIFDFFKN